MEARLVTVGFATSRFALEEMKQVAGELGIDLSKYIRGLLLMSSDAEVMQANGLVCPVNKKNSYMVRLTLDEYHTITDRFTNRNAAANRLHRLRAPALLQRIQEMYK